MTVDVTCKSCDATFDVDLSDLLEESALECPSCEARAPRAAVDGVTGALDELFSQLAIMNRKFVLSFEVDGGDLPSGYERAARRPAPDEGEDAEAEDEDSWDEEAAEREDEEDGEP